MDDRSTPRVDLPSQGVLENIPTLIAGVTRNGIVTLFNRACERLSGHARSAVVGRHCTAAIFRDTGWKVLEANLPPDDQPALVGSCEIPFLKAGGGESLVQWHISAMEDVSSGTLVYVCSGTDVTDRRRLEQQLLQAEKLSALGQLIAGVAHELNNPLTGVLGFAQIIAMRPDCPSEIRGDVESIQQSAKRCKAIVDNLLRFARQQKPERAPVNLNEIVEATITLMAYHLRAGSIEAVRELSDTLPTVSGDRNELQQVTINLVHNAIQAMKAAHGRGRLAIRTSTVDDRVRLEVSDDGPGIPSDKLTRVFDPFYTTKPVGEGTGLGLSVCFGIVTSHKGRIWAESTERTGARFVVELPAGGAEEQVERPRTTDTQMLRLKQRVLAIDDEQTVRDVLRRILTSFGFRAMVVESAEEAVKLLEREEYDIIVCDLRMPGIGGIGLYDWVAARNPELATRIVFCTGDTVSRDARDFIRRTKCRVIPKPFNVSQLAQALSEIQYEIINGAKQLKV